MPQTCTICKHPKRQEIDRALLAGEAFRLIAQRYGTSATALYRHKRNDISTSLVKSKMAAEEVKADSLFERLRELNRETGLILREARDGEPKNNGLALQAIARVEKQIELEARLLGELKEETKIAFGLVQHVHNAADFSKLTDEELRLIIQIGEKTQCK